MTHASLCTGIGACELAATWMGWENLFSCEIDEFCNKVLKYHYPKAIHYGNIFEQDFREWRGRIDVLTAGFPCQVYSLAGKRLGDKDDRYLWPQVLRVIDEIRPTWFVGENVAGILSMVLSGEEVKVGSYTDVCGESYTMHETRQVHAVEQIKRDLASIGYSLQPVVIPACAVGAPHRRDRVWFLARRDDVTDTDGNGHSSRGESKESKECRCGNISQQEKRGNSTEWIDGLFRFSRFTPDTDGAGLQETGIQQRATGVAGDGIQGITTNPSESGFQERVNDGKREVAEEARTRADDGLERLGGKQITTYSKRVGSDKIHEHLQPEQPNGAIVDGISGERDATDTDIKRLPAISFPNGIEKEEWRNEDGSPMQYTCDDRETRETNRWQNFPTQSPVCDRDDGISLGLSGITFSRWRQESIKALGNSMVAPLVYEIFLAIEQVEQIK